jgi:2-polyprenyl-6-methoxyphenol hydroxylase-like FAD-dependent oxidoreductase
VDVALLQRVTGIGEEPPVVHGVDRDTTAWHLLQAWLEEPASRFPGVTVHRGTQVTSVLPGSAQRSANVLTADGAEYPADLVIGADGARGRRRPRPERSEKMGRRWLAPAVPRWPWPGWPSPP